MPTHNTAHLYDLDKDALVALVLGLVTGEVAHKPEQPEPKGRDHLATCGSERTISGDPCGTLTVGGRDCGRHNHDDATLAKKREESESFLATRRKYAAKAKAKGNTPKVDNKALAAALRAVGVTPNGEAWGIAKGHVTEDGMSIEDAAAKVAPDYKG